MKSHDNIITELLNLQGVSVKRIAHADQFVKVFIETKPSEQICPCCGSVTSKIHDYRIQTVKDLPFQLKHCYLVLKKRRYVCKQCNKRFFEKYDFLPKYFQRTSRLTYSIAGSFQETLNITQVANKHNVSTTTVCRILDSISYGIKKVPSILSIDEFKGNAEGEKFQCILVDGSKSKVFDILPSRDTSALSAYFKALPKSERNRVEFFSCDMWRPYADLAHVYFPNAKVVIDRYHFTRMTFFALESVRKRLQREMLPSIRRYYKRSKRIFTKPYKALTQEQKKQCDIMLLYNEDLRIAHRLKEDFQAILRMNKYSEQRIAFNEWIAYAQSCGIREFVEVAKTYQNWHREILNSFKYKHISNGATEGYNNKIKVLKRISYGVTNFKRFRNRILLATT